MPITEPNTKIHKICCIVASEISFETRNSSRTPVYECQPIAISAVRVKQAHIRQSSVCTPTAFQACDYQCLLTNRYTRAPSCCGNPAMTTENSPSSRTQIEFHSVTTALNARHHTTTSNQTAPASEWHNGKMSPRASHAHLRR